MIGPVQWKFLSSMPYAERNLERFAAILADTAAEGALVGFVLPFSLDQAKIYWQGVIGTIAASERILICATIQGQIAGTVQLYLSPEPNAPHRAEIFKLLVDRDFQGQGVGAALMMAAEGAAVLFERSLFMLDTVVGGAGERLYRRLGWQEIGIVPHHFVDPRGNSRDSVYFMKVLDLAGRNAG